MALSDNFDFFTHHKDLGNIYFDSDMSALRSCFSKLNDIFTTISKRHARHDTVKVAKSVFDYVSAQDSLLQAPSRFYQFRCGDVYVYASRVGKDYVISADGLYLHHIDAIKSSYTINDAGSILCDDLDHLIKIWPDVVSCVCLSISNRFL